MRILAASILLLMVAACGKQVPPAPSSEPEVAPAETVAAPQMETVGEPVSLEDMRNRSLAEIDRAGCEENGGEVTQEGMLGLYRCVLPYKDAGKACRSSEDCEGKCVADDSLAVGAEAEGKCQPTDSPFGCYAEVVDGKVATAICVD